MRSSLLPAVITGVVSFSMEALAAESIRQPADKKAVESEPVPEVKYRVVGTDPCVATDRQTGAIVFRWEVRANLPDTDSALIRDAWTTAGMKSDWTYCLRAGLVDHEGRTYHITRTWWDRRVIADITGRRIVEDPSPALIAAADEADRRFVMETLNGAAERLQPFVDNHDAKGLDWPDYWRIRTAVHVAGRLRVADAAPMLREIAGVDLFTAHIGGAIGTKSHALPFDPMGRSEREFRQAACLALRRMGERPPQLPCTRFSIYYGNSTYQYVPGAPLGEARETRIDRVREGIEPMEVLDAIGAPDFVNQGEKRELTSWEYDMDGDRPFTLRIHWRAEESTGVTKAMIARLERFDPPLWERGEERYLVLVRD